MAFDVEFKRKIIEEYLNNGSLRKVAKKFKIHYLTLWKWLRDYKENGGKILEKKYKNQKNKISEKFSKDIYLFKEKNPWCTIKECKMFLEKKGIKVSEKTIWKVWEKAGFSKDDKKDSLYSPLAISNSENISLIEKAKSLLEKKEIKKAYILINSMMGYPLDPFIKNIPDKFLSDRRKLDKIYLSFGEIPLEESLKKLENLRKIFLRKKHIYSYIKCALLELMYLSWIHDIKKEAKLLKSLEKYTKKIKKMSINFLFAFHKGIFYSYILKGKEAKKFYRICKKIAYLKNKSQYWNIMGSFATFLGEYKEAFYFYKKALITEKNEEYKNYWKIRMASCLAHMGNFHESLKILKESESKPLIFNIHSKIIEAMCNFGKGKFEKCINILNEIIKEARKEQLRNYVHVISLIMASVNRFWGNKKESLKFLKRELILLKNSNMRRDLIIREILLKKKTNIEKFNEILNFPLIKLLFYLEKSQNSIKNYYNALNFAKQKGILLDFYRFIPFYPKSIENLSRANKKSYIPNCLLKFPIFETENINFKINILRRFEVKKEGKIIDEIFFPQEESFIVFLAINYKKGEISLTEIYENFWNNILNPYENFKNLLYRIRKKLKIPSTFLNIKSLKGEKYLIIKKIVFYTDYENFKNSVFRARMMEKIGEIEKALKEYENAFKIFEEMPFQKCYNKFCENIRTEILMNLYENLPAFLRLLKYKGKNKLIKRIVNKFSKFIPLNEIIDELNIQNSSS